MCSSVNGGIITIYNNVIEDYKYSSDGRRMSRRVVVRSSSSGIGMEMDAHSRCYIQSSIDDNVSDDSMKNLWQYGSYINNNVLSIIYETIWTITINNFL